MDKNKINAQLDDLAKQFEQEVQEKGWGQFIRVPKRHTQTGLYGNSAGTLVLHLAGRGMTFLMKQTLTNLENHWKNREQELYESKRFIQTIRLAFLNLAFRLSNNSNFNATSKEIRETLIKRFIPSKGWGNFWINETTNDPTPRLVPTAIVLISFSIFSKELKSKNEILLQAANWIEGRIASSMKLTSLETSLAIAALLFTKGPSVSKKTLAFIRRNALSAQLDLKERGIYDYTYQYYEDLKSLTETKYSQDYFIIPIEIIFGIGGFQPSAPSSLRFRAENTLSALLKNLEKNNGVYFPPERDLVSTVDQAWAAILLKSAVDNDEKRVIYKNLWYQLIRTRKDNWVTKTIGVVSVLAITVINVLVKDLGMPLNAITALVTLLIGSLYGTQYIAKLIPGRK